MYEGFYNVKKQSYCKIEAIIEKYISQQQKTLYMKVIHLHTTSFLYIPVSIYIQGFQKVIIYF